MVFSRPFVFCTRVGNIKIPRSTGLRNIFTGYHFPCTRVESCKITWIYRAPEHVHGLTPRFRAPGGRKLLPARWIFLYGQNSSQRFSKVLKSSHEPKVSFLIRPFALTFTYFYLLSLTFPYTTPAAGKPKTVILW